jgi:phosphate starvation-inducible membrane PsiE
MLLVTLQEFLPWTVFLIAPAIVLAVGSAVSFLSASLRKMAGTVLITFGVFELVFLAGTIQADISGGFGVPLGIFVSVGIGAATFISGIVSLTCCKEPC